MDVVQSMESAQGPIPFDQYEADMRELAQSGAAAVEELRRQLREREIIMWAMVRAAGGSLLVRQSDIAKGYPKAWRIDEDVAENGQRYTVTR